HYWTNYSNYYCQKTPCFRSKPLNSGCQNYLYFRNPRKDYSPVHYPVLVLELVFFPAAVLRPVLEFLLLVHSLLPVFLLVHFLLIFLVPLSTLLVPLQHLPKRLFQTGIPNPLWTRKSLLPPASFHAAEYLLKLFPNPCLYLPVLLERTILLGYSMYFSQAKS